MSFGVGFGDIVLAIQLATATYSALKDAPKEFEGLSLEVRSLQISLKSLTDEDTCAAILQHARKERQQNLKVLLRNCETTLAPLNDLILKYPALGPSAKHPLFDKVSYVMNRKPEVRNTLAMHTASINMFLTSLTHSSLGRLERLLMNAGSPSVNASRQPLGTPGSSTPDDGLDGAWLAIGRDLVADGVSKESVVQFGGEISAYMRYLLRGGRPLSKNNFGLTNNNGSVSSVSNRSDHEARRRAKLAPEILKKEDDKVSPPPTLKRMNYALVETDPVDEVEYLFDKMLSVDDEDLIEDIPLPPRTPSPPEVKAVTFDTKSPKIIPAPTSPSSTRSPSNPAAPKNTAERTPVPHPVSTRPQISSSSSSSSSSREEELKATRAKIKSLRNKQKAYHKSGETAKAAEISTETIPATLERLKDLCRPRLECNVCNVALGNGHSFFCSICDDGEYDLCAKCYRDGERCYSKSHRFDKYQPVG